jgi:peroxisomal 3,2-trans-enoyl-CoA isomerase
LFTHSEIFPESPVEEFHKGVKQRVAAEIDGLVTEAVLKTKELLRLGLKEKNDMDSVLLREGYAQAERFVTGVPTERFRRIARKEIRHKL